MAALPLSGGGLRVLVSVAAPISHPGGMPLPWSALAILIIGLAFSIGLYVMLSRHAADVPIAALVPAPSADAALASIGRYTIVERIGQGGMAEIFAAVTQGRRQLPAPGCHQAPAPRADHRSRTRSRSSATRPTCWRRCITRTSSRSTTSAARRANFSWPRNMSLAAISAASSSAVSRRRTRPPPVEVIAYVGVELLKALEYAHGLTNEMGRPLGIVHRDVSPENVMVSARGEVKLLDFGVVKADEGRVARTEMGVVKGNVTYMAPEQARGLDVDSRADLYSLALVLYTLAAGEPLYSEETTYALLMKAGAGPGVEDRSAIRELPHPLAAVIERATATSIEDRYPNARAMAADLEAAARNGAAATAALVVELFGADLKEESHRMATFAPLDSMRSAARLTSGRTG